MNLIDHLFGSGAANSMLGRTDVQNQINDQFDSAYGNYAAQSGSVQAAQQASAFNQKLNNWNKNPFAQTSQWVFAGKQCTLQEFADQIWPNDHEDKMLFILTHSGPAK
jgi:hypothetical protein